MDQITIKLMQGLIVICVMLLVNNQLNVYAADKVDNEVNIGTETAGISGATKESMTQSSDLIKKIEQMQKDNSKVLNKTKENKNTVTEKPDKKENIEKNNTVKPVKTNKKTNNKEKTTKTINTTYSNNKQTNNNNSKTNSQVVKNNVSNNNNIAINVEDIANNAIQQSDPLICDQIKVNISKTEEVEDFEKLKKEKVNNCYSSYAIAKNNIETCKMISSEPLSADCMFKVIKNTNSFTVDNCRKIKKKANDKNYKFSSCLGEIVKQTQDTSICGKHFRKYSPSWVNCNDAGKKASSE